MKSIIHTHISSYWCSVERLHDGTLAKRPLAVAPTGQSRALVWDASWEARRCGVYPGMPTDLARKRCRDLYFVPPHPELYREMAGKLGSLAEHYTPNYQVGDRGRVFLDATGTEMLFGGPVKIAREIGQHLQGDWGFHAGNGIGKNLLVSEIAGKVISRQNADAPLLVKPGQEQTFLSPLAVSLLPDLSKPVRQGVRNLNVHEIGEIARCSVEQLEPVFRRETMHLWEMANGIDHRTLQSPLDPPFEVMREHHFAEDTNDSPMLLATFSRLVDEASYEMRVWSRSPGSVRVLIRYTDAVEHFRKKGVATGTNDFFSLYALTLPLFEEASARRVRIRTIQVTFSGKREAAVQTSLFEEAARSTPKQTAVCQAMDSIRRKFGRESVRLGREFAVAGASA